MTDISFDREAVGVFEKAQWTDAQDLAQVGAAVGKLRIYGVAFDLPEGDNAGVAALRAALDNFRDYMSAAVLEYSDACSELGSGAKEVSQDMDETETFNRDKARVAATRLGVGEYL